MEYEIISRPSYSLVEFKLDIGESVLAEAGAMVYMKNVDMDTRVFGGIFAGLKRKILGGESFFMNLFTGRDGSSVVGLAPMFPGDVEFVKYEDELFVQHTSLLACSPDTDIDVKFVGIGRMLFGREGAFLLKLRNLEWATLASFGGIKKIDLEGDNIVVDNGNLVAFTPGLKWDVKGVKGLKSFFFSGEGFVFEFSGSGSVWIQTRTTDTFMEWIAAHLGFKSGGAKETFEEIAGSIFSGWVRDNI